MNTVAMSTALPTLASQLQKLNSISNRRNEIGAILEVYINAHPQEPNKEVINDLEVDHSVEFCIATKITKGRLFLSVFLRDYLIL